MCHASHSSVTNGHAELLVLLIITKKQRINLSQTRHVTAIKLSCRPHMVPVVNGGAEPISSRIDQPDLN